MVGMLNGAAFTENGMLAPQKIKTQNYHIIQMWNTEKKG